MFVRLMFVAAALLISLSVRLHAEDTEQRIARFGQELSSAWSTYPLEKDTTVRKQKITDVTTAVNAELMKLDAPENVTLQRAVDNMSSNIQKVRSYLKQDKMQGERLQYVSMCAAAFRRETMMATDMEAERTASKCFEMMIEWADQSRVALRTVPDDVHSPYYTALTELFNRMVKGATKDAGDPTEIYDKQLKEIKRRFPIVGAFQKTNQPIVSIMEVAAKGVNTRNKAP
jgi:vacuolar-type H+-ATPase catalytic subunit A/Vma1